MPLRNAQAWRRALAGALAETGRADLALPDLNGRRGKGPQSSPNPARQIEAFRNYADCKNAPAFAAGVTRLLVHTAAQPCAVTCAVQHPSQCRRRLIADKLASLGHEVVHLLSPAEHEPHRPPPFLRIDRDRLRYDLPVDEPGQDRLV